MQTKDFRTMVERATRQLADDERMRHDAALVEQILEVHDSARRK